MFERSEFLTLPIFVSHNWEAEGQWQRGRLSLLTFFGEAKKVSGCRATPDLLAMSLCEGQYGSKYAVTRSRKVD
ncbi:hypothetical protein [Undibacterium macrobrachii]|uniref:Uncharacterized protein n=1 Tax=Undibacterium macrobrachii TaxID=1119058 RepID=A0ABQ2XAU7_9BURK|nr:hypothetical protein [Undibacterium macrobrachii]GGX08096.1 hypothetical protein GCM10011282_12640 [Undibacterium macrobrachii]